MPRLVNYSDRFDAVREAVYVLTLREGPGAINLPAVAAELDLSTRSLHRLLSSTRHLPMLGLQWAEGVRRRRLINTPRSRVTDPQATLLAEIIMLVPGGPSVPDDERAWWLLVTMFEATEDWARAARLERHRLVEALATKLVALPHLSDQQQQYERERLCALVEGIGRRIQGGRLSHEHGAALLRRHAEDLFDSSPRASDDAA